MRILAYPRTCSSDPFSQVGFSTTSWVFWHTPSPADLHRVPKKSVTQPTRRKPMASLSKNARRLSLNGYRQNRNANRKKHDSFPVYYILPCAICRTWWICMADWRFLIYPLVVICKCVCLWISVFAGVSERLSQICVWLFVCVCLCMEISVSVCEI